MKKCRKVQIIDKLLDDCLFDDRKEALSWIMMRKVYANEELILTAGQKVEENACIRIRDYFKKYVNKGGLKLEGALKDFNIDVKGKTTLDSGASTGGFTDCLIKSGAKKVYAVEVGFGQLSGVLRQNQRVVNMEKTNIGDPVLLNIDERPEIVTLDLSYLTLKKAIPICASIMKNKGVILGLVKPLYEVESHEIRRSGNINNKDTFYNILMDLVNYINFTLNYNVFGITYSHVRGNKGTIEFFIGVSLDNNKLRKPLPDIEKDIIDSIEKGWQLDEFNKNENDFMSS